MKFKDLKIGDLFMNLDRDTLYVKTGSYFPKKIIQYEIADYEKIDNLNILESVEFNAVALGNSSCFCQFELDAEIIQPLCISSILKKIYKIKSFI